MVQNRSLTRLISPVRWQNGASTLPLKKGERRFAQDKEEKFLQRQAGIKYCPTP
jgi:hypothetical protein